MATEHLNLKVNGMTCGNCVRMVERRLASTPGVSRAMVDLDAGSAQVDYDPAQASPEALADAVRALGYEVPA